jgi:ATP-dependent DNA helicase 2 subunit 2
VADAIARLVIPPTKDTRPVPNYKGTLTLGDNETFEESVTIDVERYPCTMVAKPPSASSFVARTDLGPEPGASTQSSATIKVENHQASGQLAAVRNQRVYQVDNPDEPGVKMNVEPDELERGYEYGRTAVHISEADQTVVKLETSQSLAIIGFVPDDKVRIPEPFNSSMITYLV